MKSFIKLLLLFLGSNLFIFIIFFSDQWNTSNASIGGGGYDLAYLYYLIAVILFLVFFNLFLAIATLYLKSKARETKTTQSFLWISVPALLLALGLFLSEL